MKQNVWTTYVLKKQNMWRAIILDILKAYLMCLAYFVFSKKSWPFTDNNETECVESYDRLRTDESEGSNSLHTERTLDLVYSDFFKKS